MRPTAEHVRAALLDLVGSDIVDACVLDLFAGTGAFGLEALSRGAKSADFVEIGPSSLHALRASIAALRLRDRTRIFKRDALPFAGALVANSYDVAFSDPPYGSRMLDRLIETWQRTAFSPILAIEHERKHVLPIGAERRIFGDTAITIYRR